MSPSWLFPGQSDYVPRLSADARLFVEGERYKAASQWSLLDKPWHEWTHGLPKVPACAFDGSHSAVVIGDPTQLSTEDQTTILQRAKALCPWKKGPFTLFGQGIDAEWRSDFKWERLRPHLNLRGKTVLDIGCHNGYFMFRSMADQPALVVGLEPVSKPAMTFQFLQHYAQQPSLFLEPTGVDRVDLFSEFFDVVLCLGILYHHTDPINLLRKIRSCMTPSGQLWVDCQGIPGDGSYVLVPPGRYGGASGIWWVPTVAAVSNWIHRAGFRAVESVYSAPLSTEEQRATPWAPIKSFADFLDPSDPSKTIEGHPAPWRHYVRAYK